MSNVRNFGAAGDGRADDTAAILHALQKGDGTLEFPRGDYLISRTIEVDEEAGVESAGNLVDKERSRPVVR